jgi:hypothetical protein
MYTQGCKHNNKEFFAITLYFCLTRTPATESNMQDIPGADTDDGVFDAPSPIEMEVYEGGAHDDNPAQGDVDSRFAQQTPPHGHDSEQGILDRSKNICFFIFGLKDVYFIFTYTPSLFSLYFCSPSTSFREHFKCR